MDPLPTINRLILQDEKQRELSKGNTSLPEATAFAVRNNSCNSEKTFTTKNSHLKCKKCNKLGHTSESCRAHLKCDCCGWHGHIINVCRKLQKINTASGKVA